MWEKKEKKNSTNNFTLGCSQGYKILKIIIHVYRCSIYSLNCYYCYHHSSACGKYDEIVTHLKFMKKISFLVLVRSRSFIELFISTSWQSKSIFFGLNVPRGLILRWVFDDKFWSTQNHHQKFVNFHKILLGILKLLSNKQNHIAKRKNKFPCAWNEKLNYKNIIYSSDSQQIHYEEKKLTIACN